MRAVLHLWLGQRPVFEQAKKLVPLKRRGYEVNNDSILTITNYFKIWSTIELQHQEYSKSYKISHV